MDLAALRFKQIGSSDPFSQQKNFAIRSACRAAVAQLILNVAYGHRSPSHCSAWAICCGKSAARVESLNFRSLEALFEVKGDGDRAFATKVLQQLMLSNSLVNLRLIARCQAVVGIR